MELLKDEYVSEYGWAIDLPAGWEKLPDSGPGAIALHKPVVFCRSDDYDLSLTWMVAGHPMSQAVADRFVTAVATLGPVDKPDIASIIQGTFPLIGEADKAEVIELADGSHALEVTEKYSDTTSTDMHGGYQLIWPVKDVSNYPLTFQRLCFYAPFRKFFGVIGTVRQAARSMRYLRPFGIEVS